MARPPDTKPATKAKKATKTSRAVEAIPARQHGRTAAAAAAKKRDPSPAILAVRPAPKTHPPMGVPAKSQRRKKIKPPR